MEDLCEVQLLVSIPRVSLTLAHARAHAYIHSQPKNRETIETLDRCNLGCLCLGSNIY